MSRTNLISYALQDLGDDIMHHATNIGHGVFELCCLLAVGSVVYVSSMDPANAGYEPRAMFGVQASIEVANGAAVSASHAPTSCSLTNDLLSSVHRSCITALVLEPMDI